MKVVKKTGLVPVYSLQTGDIFGVSPDKARAMVEAKQAQFVDPPEGVEFYETADKVKPPKVESVAEVYDVEIPENWEKSHHLQKIKLAKTLTGDDSVKTLKVAEEVIASEVQRRAAAAPAAE